MQCDHPCKEFFESGLCACTVQDKARLRDARTRGCEKGGGHEYTVDGFSRIAHPEVEYFYFPRNMETVQFRSYVCRRCGSRVSVEEGRRYMRKRSGVKRDEPWRP